MGIGSNRVALAAISTVIALVAGLASATETLAAHWQVHRPPTPTPASYTGEQYFSAASCPAPGGCLLAGEPNLLASSNDPAGDGSWSFAQPVEEQPCEDNPKRCEVPPVELPPGFPAQLKPWQQRTNTDISCPGAGFCAVSTLDGFVYVSTDPFGGTGAWRVFDLDGEGPNTHLESISCPDPSFCVAVAGNPKGKGAILSSTNPTGGPGAWQEVDLGEDFNLRGVACGTRSLCVAVGTHGRVIRSLNPAGPASAWDDLGTPGGSGNFGAIECVGTTLCVAGNAGGNLLVTSNPGAARPDWREANGGASVLVTDIACPDTGHCLAVDDNGDVIASVDPDGGPGAWSIENLIPFVERDQNELPVAPNGIFAVACASTSLCVLGATEARIYSSTDPFSTPPPPHSAKRGKRRGPTRPRTHIVAVDHARNFSGKGVLPVRFRFYAKGARGFRCRRDGGHWRHCHSPHRYLVGLGQHTFRVRAVGRTGLLGPVATKSFRIRKSGTCHPPQC